MELLKSKVIDEVTTALEHCNTDICTYLSKDKKVIFNTKLKDELELQVVILKKYAPPAQLAVQSAIIDIVKPPEKKVHDIFREVGSVLPKYCPTIYPPAITVTYADISVALYEIIRAYKPAYLREMILVILSSNCYSMYDRLEQVVKIFRKAFDDMDNRETI